MKALGLAGAGVGSAALVAPNFHDLDEVAASGDTMQKHPWYIKERERLDPTVEIDWDMVKRYDRRQMGQSAYIRAKYYGKANVERIVNGSAALQQQRMVDNVPGFGHRWEALRTLGSSQQWSVSYLGPEISGKISVTTPESLGVPKWIGTPEENFKMVVAATRLFGYAEVGANNLDSTWRNKLVAFNEKGSSTGMQWIDTPPEQMPDSAARPIVYENVDDPYYTKDKWVIPANKDLNVVYFGAPEPRETDRTYPSRISKSNLVLNSGVRNVVYYNLYKFFRALGYNLVGGTGHGTDCFQTPGVAVFTGKAEAARMSNWVLSPEWGPRSTDLAQITDMPLAETHPIDGGLWKFCQTCGICADSCPSNSIPGLDAGDPSYEMAPINGKPDTQHATGMKRYVYNGSSCNLYTPEFIPGSGCSACAAYCTFSTGSGAIVHSVLKSTIANVSLFNPFLANMGRTFGYGAFESPEEWWDSSLPQFGIDSTLTAVHGGYAK
jgi:reductive dehalogenase